VIFPIIRRPSGASSARPGRAGFRIPAALVPAEGGMRNVPRALRSAHGRVDWSQRTSRRRDGADGGGATPLADAQGGGTEPVTALRDLDRLAQCATAEDGPAEWSL